MAGSAPRRLLAGHAGHYSSALAANAARHVQAADTPAVLQSRRELRETVMKTAFVLYPDFTALDLVGPYEVISRWPGAEVHFLATSLEPVRCDEGLTVIPTDTPATLADPELIVVPGSGNPVPVL